MADPTRRVRRGRPPAGQSALSREVILETAMALVDAGGVDELSMRTVARELGVDPKSLYNHVVNKDALLNGMAELILSRMKIPPLQGSLRVDLPALAAEFRVAVHAGHARAARLLLTRPIESITNLAPMDAVLGVFLRSGADPELAVHLLRTVFAFMTGTLLREADSVLTYAQNDPVDADERAESLVNGEFPNVGVVAAYLASCNHEREYEFGIEVLTDAFARLLDC